ncbi:MAG: hydrolase [Myxococcales bacterium]|nr:hydrolase [Myxococcales bacterium]
MVSMTPIRDPKKDALLTPENAALLIIDYQPTQVNSINSTDRKQLVHNIHIVAKIAKLYRLPTLLTTVNVSTGRNHDTIPSLREVLQDTPSYDRTTMNAWEDAEFYAAVKATKRQKLLICALWTEVCLTFPTLDALREGYEVFPIVDAVAGTSMLAHETALRRIERAGAQFVTIAQLTCELQRDWNRKESVEGFLDIMFDSGAFLKL